MALDKRELLTQLRDHLAERLSTARRAEADARDAARTLATESEKKEDGRAVIEFGSLATGQGHRSQGAIEELEQLERLLRDEPPRFRKDSKVQLLALVDVLITPEEGEPEGRTLFMLPLGAGTELVGPGGDGFLSVITPASPVGKALMGKRAGEVTDVTIHGALREVEILEVS